MFTDKQNRDYYQALLDKNTEYEGIFFVGVKTTGVFCRPSCPARKPLFKNCLFFKSAQEALDLSFKPCKRCHPLKLPHQTTPLMQYLIQAVKEEPEKRWKEKDFKDLSIDVSTIRRQFKKRFGMTFNEYARKQRLELAIKQMKKGNPVIDTQLSSGYESSSGFREAFWRLVGTPPSKIDGQIILKATWLDTPLGQMIAIADEQKLYVLEFTDRRHLQRQLKRVQKLTGAIILPGEASPIFSIEKELQDYFKGTLQKFNTPIELLGTDFQKQVWSKLIDIPYAETRSYGELALHIEKATAFRAVAQANGANAMAIIIPCHRVINRNGELGGYAGGLARKTWLLEHEKTHCKTH